MEKICKECGKTFSAYSSKRLYCTRECKKSVMSKRGFCSQYPGIPAGTVGAISELRACQDLMAKGYEVFRAVSPSSSCDIAVLKDGKLLRIEVRTSYKDISTGKITRTKTGQDEGRQDVFAWVLPDSIVYEPSL